MTRGLRSLLAILVVFLGLGAYIYFVESKRPAASDEEAKDRVFAVESDDIRELRIRAENGDTTDLQKEGVGTAWQLTAPLAATADSAEVSGVVTNLASLELQRVVEESPADLGAFGLADPRIDVAYKAEGDDDFTHLLIGEKTATGSDLYAKLSTEDRVFLISGFLDTTFNRSSFDLRDKTVLELDTQTVDRLEVATPDATVEVTRTEGDWRLTRPLVSRADYGTVQGLLGRLSTAQMTALVADDAADLAPYGLAEPSATVTLGTGSAVATLAFGAESGDSGVYARDLSRPAIFTVDASLVDELKKGPDDYRSKDLFGFRPFNATRFEITRDGETAVYEKAETSGETSPAEGGEDEGDAGPTEEWRQVAPATRTIDADRMQTTLSGMANLRALYFAGPDVQTGLETAAVVVMVHYEDGKVDRVSFGLDEQDVYAAVEGEPGAARIDTNDYNLALKSLIELDAAEPVETPG